MAVTNHERVGKALELLKTGLYPFIERELKSTYQEKAETIQIETSFTDLVNSLQTTVDTIETLLINTVGRVLVTLLALLLIILFVFSAMFFFKPGFVFGGALDTGDETTKPDDE